MRLRLGLPALLLLAACGDAAEKKTAPAITYHGDVEPILAKHCVGCHRAGGAAPFALDGYAAAGPLAASIAQAVAARTMPPFNANNGGDCNTFRGARWLSDDEIARIGTWAAAGAPAGAPRAPTPPPGDDALAAVDATLDPGATYTPSAAVADDYRCFVVDAPAESDVYLTGFAVRPAHPQMSHHLILYALDTTEAEAAALAKDAADDGPGYTCYGGPDVAAKMVGGWAPGSAVTRYPEDTGIRLAGGRKLVMQWHYNTAGGAKPDRPTVDLQLAASVLKPLIITPLAEPGLYIPPGDGAAEASVALPLDFLPRGGVDLHGVFPHMHQLGSKLKVELEQAGETTCLLDVDRWNFAWQQLFLFEEPVHVDPFGAVRLTCTFDATARDEPVTWGEGTQDEMCINYFFVTL